MSSLISEINFKIWDINLKIIFWGTLVQNLKSRGFEKVNLENFGENYVDLVSFR